MKFSNWIKKRNQTNIIKVQDSAQRIAGGRKDTSFKSKKDKGTRSDKNRKAIRDSLD